MIDTEVFGVPMNIVKQAGALWNSSWVVTMMYHGVLDKVLFLAYVVK